MPGSPPAALQGSGLSKALSFSDKSRTPSCSATVPPVAVSVSPSVQRPRGTPSVEAPHASRPDSPPPTPLKPRIRPVSRCGKQGRLGPHVVHLPSIREEVDAHERTCSSAHTPLDAGKVFRPSTSSQGSGTHDDNPDQVASILHARKIIYEVNPATLQPVDFSLCPATPKDHRDEVLALHSTLPFEESPYIYSR